MRKARDEGVESCLFFSLGYYSIFRLTFLGKGYGIRSLSRDRSPQRTSEKIYCLRSLRRRKRKLVEPFNGALFAILSPILHFEYSMISLKEADFTIDLSCIHR